ncbi:MAG: ATP phosphoribosyltransferase regulatory subunit [Campylobacterota bacterium]|nr:ATP phosphoribosyltransferase regulatory subunit [Campylobacterota bacterium]
MILEHEIPTGSKLYFGKTAKAKRTLESLSSEFLQSNGFEEIITPNFSYSQHQSIDNEKDLIFLNDESNNKLALRADSTLDVVRIITKRLGRATEHKKWFYIQPVFSYPANETYQIGAEWIGHDNISDLINFNSELLNKLNIDSLVQLANINIPLIISKKYNIDIELFKNGEIGSLFKLNIPWLTKLINSSDAEDLNSLMSELPNELKFEIQKLIDIANSISHKNITISPLYYSAMRYYDDLYYRVITDNLTIANGGGYKSEGINSLGFALYTDNILKVLEGKEI